MEFNNNLQLYGLETLCKKMENKLPQNYVLDVDDVQNITVYDTSMTAKDNNLIIINANCSFLTVTKLLSKDKGAEFDIVGYKKIKSDQLVYKSDKPIGIIRDKNDNESKQYIEIFDKSEVKTGDVLTMKQRILCKDNILYTNHIYHETAEYFANFLIKKFNEYVKLSNFTIAFSDNSALTLLNKQKFDNIVLIELADIDKEQTDIEFNKGACIVMKSGGYTLRQSFYDKISCLFSDNCGYQFYFGKEASLAEKIEISFGIPVYLVAIPVKFRDSDLAEVSADDIKSAAELAFKISERI